MRKKQTDRICHGVEKGKTDKIASLKYAQTRHPVVKYDARLPVCHQKIEHQPVLS